MDFSYGARVSENGRGVTYRYQEVRHSVTQRGPCPVCGKRRTRSMTFTATVSPFNRDETGEPRTPYQVRQKLVADSAVWEPDFSCQTHQPAEVCAATRHQPGAFQTSHCMRCGAVLRGEVS
jgi:ribosomal protein L37AE/L43A